MLYFGYYEYVSSKNLAASLRFENQNEISDFGGSEDKIYNLIQYATETG